MIKAYICLTPIILLCVMACAVRQCHAEEWVEPPAPMASQFVSPIDLEQPFVGLTYSQHCGRLYLRDQDGNLYGTINLRNGVVVLNGPGLVADGYFDQNMNGPSAAIDLDGFGSVVVGRVAE